MWKELNKEIVKVNLEKRGKTWVKVVGKSMEPLIRKGERVLVERKDPDGVLPGDVIMYSVDGNLITHRAVGKFFHQGSWFFLERGELGKGIGRISGESLLGKVILVEREGREVHFDKLAEEWRKTLGKRYALLTFIYAVFFKLKHLLGLHPKRLKRIFLYFFLTFERKLRKKEVFVGGEIEKS